MTHRRTRLPGAARTYGVLVGHVVRGQEDSGGTSPHYQILVQADGAYRLAVNVRSVDGSDVLAYLDPDFTEATRIDLPSRASGAAGFSALATGPEGEGIDYLRDALFPLSDMSPVAAGGGDAGLSEQLDGHVRAAAADTGSVVVVLGEFFRDKGADQSFGFSPEQGIHDIHMMQGNGGDFAGDNRVRGDGALFLRASSGTTVALFVRFSTQSISTDPTTGTPD